MRRGSSRLTQHLWLLHLCCVLCACARGSGASQLATTAHSGMASVSIAKEAPAFMETVTDYFESATIMSECPLAPEVKSELAEHLGETLVQSTVAVEELNRISKTGESPNIVMASTWVNGLLRTLSEVHFGTDQFGPNEQKADSLKPILWKIPSPIGPPVCHDDRRERTKLILGKTCTSGALNVAIDSPEESRLQRSLRAQEPNVSIVVATARVSDNGAEAISGAEYDEELWENKLAAAAAKMQGLSSQGPVFPRAHLLMFYRTDWFEELGIASVPNTWDELIALARTMSGLDGFVSTEGVGPNKVPGYENFESWPHSDSLPLEPIRLQQVLPRGEDMGGNSTRFALCLDLAPYCQGAYVLNAIFASISQTQGTWQNAFMDPVELELLSIKHPELVKEALQVYRDLAQASHLPTSLHSCSAVSHLFAIGRCAITINWEHAFPYMYNSPPTDRTKTAGGSNSSEPHPAAKSLVGNIGVSPLPGSSRVYDRAARVTKQCDPSTCPLATREEITSYSRGDSVLPSKAFTSSDNSTRSSSSSQNAQSNDSGSGSGSERSNSTTSQGKQSSTGKSEEEQRRYSAMGSKRLVVEGQRTAWVNRAPYSVYPPAGLALCNPLLDDQGRDTGEYQTKRIAATSQALNMLAIPMVAAEMSMAILLGKKMASLGEEKAILALTLAHKGNLGSPADELPAKRQELLQPPDFSDQELESWWLNEVYTFNDYWCIDIADSKRFFQALWKASYVYQNQAPEFLSMPTSTQGYRIVAAEVALYAASSPTFSIERAMQGFRNRSVDAQNAEVADRQAVEGAVWRATGFDRTMIDVLPAQQDSSSSSSSLSEQETAGAILGPILFVLLVAILIVFLVTRKRWLDHRNLFGVILPPKAGPQTTLLLTDIEGSTQMWETLQEHLCDEVISLHNRVIRKQLHMHYGYECGTEGDAFTLAFHTVADALLFAASAQVELLYADWPGQLLELEACRPVYVLQPMMPDNQQVSFLKRKRKSDGLMLFELQESDPELQKAWSSSEVALGFDFSSIKRRASSKQLFLNNGPTPKAPVRSKESVFLSNLKAYFGRQTSQQELQAQSRQPHPLCSPVHSNTPRLRLALNEDTLPPASVSEVKLMRGKSSGLLAFDAALVSTAVDKGSLNKARDKETGLKGTEFNKEAGSKSAKLITHRPTVTANPTSLCDQSSQSFPFDPSMYPPSSTSVLSAMNESSLAPNTSSSRAPASNKSNAEQNGRGHVQFSAIEEKCSGKAKAELNGSSHVQSSAIQQGCLVKANTDQNSNGHLQDSVFERGSKSQQGSCVIDIPGAYQFPESRRASTMDNTRLTVGQQLLATMPRTHTPGPGHLLVLRGLRVRMGAASGVERQEDVQLNGAQGRVFYSGSCMAAAKAVSDAAQGGMILISPQTFQQIPAKLLQEKILVASMGKHMLGKGQEQVCMQLYQVLPRQLVHRAPQLGPLRSQQLSLGFLEAPSNRAAICFMSVSYLKALELWNPEVTAAALELWHTTVQHNLNKREGYMVEAVDGLFVAAFTRPSSAIRWALESIEACLHADWPPELLEMEMGEEHYYSPLQCMPRYSRDQQAPSSNPSVELERFKKVLLFRGLRLKVGIDWGAVKADLHAATARVDFRGRVMNRAQRISSFAKCSQVWCSEGAWEAAVGEVNNPKAFPDETIEEDDPAARVERNLHGDEPFAKPGIRPVHATPLGPHQLKGVAQPVKLYHCCLSRPADGEPVEK